MVENGHMEVKGIRRNTDHVMCPICRKEKGWNHILICEGSISLTEKLANKKFANTNSEIGIKTVSIKNKDNKKIRLYLSRYKEKWEMLVKKYKDKTD
jgi:hypothetical protein